MDDIMSHIVRSQASLEIALILTPVSDQYRILMIQANDILLSIICRVPVRVT
jgi:hypothetical protein